MSTVPADPVDEPEAFDEDAPPGYFEPQPYPDSEVQDVV